MGNNYFWIMMHRTVNILLLVLLIIIGFSSIAKQKEKGNGSDQHNAKKNNHIFMPPVYLGNSPNTRGPIRKDVLTGLLKQGLTSHDSLGNKYRVVGFNFGYAERKLYEDSVGNLVAMMDYLSEYCAGDTLSSDITHPRGTQITDNLDGTPDSTDITKSIYDRVKVGDTIYFDNIRVAKYIDAMRSAPDSDAILGKGMKFWIVK